MDFIFNCCAAESGFIFFDNTVDQLASDDVFSILIENTSVHAYNGNTADQKDKNCEGGEV